MAKRAPEEVYAALTSAGFGPDAAVVMTAIAGAESGWRDDALGDTGLEDDTWGPSYGLYQVRTAKSATGSGGVRDLTWLVDSDLHQAQAAYEISKHGTDFTAWSAYESGAWRRHLAAARNAQARAGALAAAGGGPTIETGGPSWWPDWLPWGTSAVDVAVAAGNAASGAAGTVGGVLGGARHIVIEGLVGVAAAALIGTGLWLWARGRPS